MRRFVTVMMTLGLTVAAAACGSGGDPAPGSESGVLLAAGDIAECDSEGDEQTARLLAAHPDATVATLGDNAYQHGTSEEFADCYGPSWGRFKERTRPSTGNHDYGTKDAAGYADYFDETGGPFDRYYYSYDLGDWHVVVLNSDCWRVDGCAQGDPQIEWLLRDLAQHPQRCTLAYWHRPPFSSGRYGDAKATDRVRPLWSVVQQAGVDVVLTGHEHSYERFEPMNAEGKRDEDAGTRLFVVGTGGGNLRPFPGPPLPTTAVRDAETWGVLKLTLWPGGYDWEFVPVAGGEFTDSGSADCR